MMSHGHVAEAVDYLSAPNLSGAYLFGAARRACRDAASHEDRGNRSIRSREGPQIFNRWFGLVPPDEAAAIVRDLVHGILGQPDESIHASAQDVRFSSTHAQVQNRYSEETPFESSRLRRGSSSRVRT
jgi:hypothetical protein